MGGMFPHSFWTNRYWPGTYFPPMVDEIVEPELSTQRSSVHQWWWPPDAPPAAWVALDRDEAVALALLLA